MKINPVVTVLRPHLSSPTEPNVQSSRRAPPTAHDSAAPITSSSRLSDETKKGLVFTAQAWGPDGDHTKVPPAKQARAALLADPSLAALPFGAIVSALARGEPLPVVTSSQEPVEDPPADPIVEDPVIQSTSDSAESIDATLIALIADELATAPAVEPDIDELFDPLEPIA